MKTKNIPLCLFSAIALASCQSTDTALRHGIDQGELASELSKPNIRFSKVRVDCKIVTGAKTESLAPITIRRGRSATTSMTEEGFFPTAFEFPDVKKVTEANIVPVTPANPTTFNSDNFGWTLKLGAEAQDGFIMLRGTLSDRQMGAKIQAGGKPFEPITTQASTALGRDVAVTLTDNRAGQPAVIDRKFPILIAANNGGSYRIFLDERKTSYAEFTCRVID